MAQSTTLEKMNEMFHAEYSYAELNGRDDLKSLIDDANALSRGLYAVFGHLTNEELRMATFEVSKPFVHIRFRDIQFSVNFGTNAGRKLMVLNVLFPRTTESRLQEVLQW